MQSLSDLYSTYFNFVNGEYGLPCFVIFVGLVMFLSGWFCSSFIRLVDDICLYVVPFFKRRFDSLNKTLRSKRNSSDITK